MKHVSTASMLQTANTVAGILRERQNLPHLTPGGLVSRVSRDILRNQREIEPSASPINYPRFALEVFQQMRAT